MAASVPASIEKKVRLRAPRARVWRALTDRREFGEWFGMRTDTAFAPGAAVRGVIVPTAVDAEVAKAQEPYRNRPFDITIEQMEPERLTRQLVKRLEKLGHKVTLEAKPAA